MHRYIAIDTETSHWDKTSKYCAITQIGCHWWHGLTEQEIMNPGEEILISMQPDVIGITGLTPADIRVIDEASFKLLSKITFELSNNDIIVVAHNWPFDCAVLNNECIRRGIKFDFNKVRSVDTLRVVRELYDVGVWTAGGANLPNHKLATCYYGIVPESMWKRGAPHSAGYDAMMSAQIFSTLVEMGADVDDLIEISRMTFIPRVCPMTEERGKPWCEVSDGLLQWMVNKKVWKDDEGLEFAILNEYEKRGHL